MIISSISPSAPPPPVKLRKQRRFMTRPTFWASILYFIALLAVALLLWQYSDRWWPATVLLFAPRWMMALPMLLLVPLALIYSRKSLLALTGAAALLVWPIMGLRISSETATQTKGPFLRVITCNIHRQQLDAGEFKSLIDQMLPDVIALQDWSSVHQEELFGGGAWRCRRDGELFLASRYPIIEARPIPLDEPPKPTWKIREGQAMYYHLQTPLGAVSLINLHLSSPHEGLQSLREMESDAPDQLDFNSRTRDMESASILKFARTIKGPLVILGDFNTPSESAVYSQHWGGLLDAFDVRGTGFGITHVSTASSVRIDHILLDSGWDVRQCWLGEATGSPHRPLVADLQRLEAGNSIVRIDP